MMAAVIGMSIALAIVPQESVRTSAEVSFELSLGDARRAWAEGNYKGALSSYALASDDAHSAEQRATVDYERASLLTELGNEREAGSLFRKIAGAGDPNTRCLAEQALVVQMIRAGELEKALGFSLDPPCDTSFRSMNHAAIELRLERWADAARDALQALERDPSLELSAEILTAALPHVDDRKQIYAAILGLGERPRDRRLILTDAIRMMLADVNHLNDDEYQRAFVLFERDQPYGIAQNVLANGQPADCLPAESTKCFLYEILRTGRLVGDDRCATLPDSKVAMLSSAARIELSNWYGSRALDRSLNAMQRRKTLAVSVALSPRHNYSASYDLVEAADAVNRDCAEQWVMLAADANRDATSGSAAAIDLAAGDVMARLGKITSDGKSPAAYALWLRAMSRATGAQATYFAVLRPHLAAAAYERVASVEASEGNIDRAWLYYVNGAAYYTAAGNEEGRSRMLQKATTLGYERTAADDEWINRVQSASLGDYPSSAIVPPSLNGVFGSALTATADDRRLADRLAREAFLTIDAQYGAAASASLKGISLAVNGDQIELKGILPRSVAATLEEIIGRLSDGRLVTSSIRVRPDIIR